MPELSPSTTTRHTAFAVCFQFCSMISRW